MSGVGKISEERKWQMIAVCGRANATNVVRDRWVAFPRVARGRYRMTYIYQPEISEGPDGMILKGMTGYSYLETFNIPKDVDHMRTFKGVMHIEPAASPEHQTRDLLRAMAVTLKNLDDRVEDIEAIAKRLYPQDMYDSTESDPPPLSYP